MELMLVVWFVGIVSNLPCLFFLSILAILLGSVIGAIWADSEDGQEKASRFACVREKLFRWRTCIVLAVLITIVPSEATMKYMAGAYLIQTVYQSEFTGKVVTLSEKAIIKQLEEWAKESPELAPLLQQIPKENP